MIIINSFTYTVFIIEAGFSYLTRITAKAEQGQLNCGLINIGTRLFSFAGMIPFYVFSSMNRNADKQ